MRVRATAPSRARGDGSSESRMQVAQRQQVDPYAFADLGHARGTTASPRRARGVRRAASPALPAPPARRAAVATRRVARRAVAASCRRTSASANRSGPVALQRPGRDREQHLQQAASEDQRGDARRIRRGQAHVGGHHHARSCWSGRRAPPSARARPACRQRTPRPARRRRTPASGRRSGCRAAPTRPRRRRQQHALHAQPVRARLVGEHRVERAGGHRQARGGLADAAGPPQAVRRRPPHCAARRAPARRGA